MCSRHAIISTLWLLQNIVDRKIALKWRHARHRKNAIAIVGRNNAYKKRVWYEAEKRLLFQQRPSKNWWRLDKVSSWNYNSARGVDHLSHTNPQAPLSIGVLEIWPPSPKLLTMCEVGFTTPNFVHSLSRMVTGKKIKSCVTHTKNIDIHSGFWGKGKKGKENQYVRKQRHSGWLSSVGIELTNGLQVFNTKYW